MTSEGTMADVRRILAFPPPSPPDEHDGDAREFIALNPDIWGYFVRFTLQVIEAGLRHYSARAIFHRIRWYTAIETKSGDGFKINNNHSPSFARWFHVLYPEHGDFFETRVRGSEK